MALAKVKFNEKTSGTISGTLVDENGDGIDGTALDTAFATIYLRGDASQRLRSSVDLIADPRFAITAAGVFTWTIRPEDTQILNADLALGSAENHMVYLEFSWNAASTGSLTDAFSVTSGSKIVTVNHTSHGLAVGDHAVFRNTEDSGGIDLDGVYVVKTVLNPNSYRIEHKTEATATDAAAGGTVEFFYNGNADSDELIIVTKHVDPT